ncbi:YbaB/EbfC family nucleoid-associated protein [Aestuariivivens sediminis]|uniref:YbaB/EbfC family nucleoid-associated protein n=1 Tax=Aestuariivivens sediminis TaxID=2913557 RepID=UPI001F5A13DF|nr:YbaB/EbfC family nucleoid-associated protein [Aestuariivivens sediminis]
MFGDMMSMMGKLKETQKKVEETKRRLDTISINALSDDGNIKITITANGIIKDIDINDNLLQDKVQLEKDLIFTLNKAIEQATKVNETELAAVAKEGLPNIPGLDMFK